MSKISGLTGIFATLRKNSGKVEPAGQKKDKSLASVTSPGVNQPSLDSLLNAALVKAKTQNLSTEDAANSLIRTALVWEFGDEIMDDPKFIDLVASVSLHFKENDGLMAEVQNLLKKADVNKDG